MSSNKFIARNGLAVGTTPVDIVDSTGTILVNAPTATKLQTARTISLSGDVAGSVSFDGTGNAAITTTIQPDSVALGTDTTGNYMVNVAAGTGVSVSHTQGEGSTATVSIGQAVGTTDNVTFNNVTVNGTLTSDDITSTNISVAGNATITGNLTVSGTTTTVNSTTVALADLNLELARNATTAAQANGAGITVTGPTTPATLTYTSADDRWNLNKNLNVTTVYGALSGNASTATTLQTARTINGASFDGSANITFSTTAVSEGTNLYYTDARARAALSFTAGSGAYNSTTGVITIPTNTNQLTNGAGYITGNQTITVSGDASGSGTTSIALTLANSGVTAGTYTKVTVDAKGRVTTGTTLASSDLPTYTGTITSSQVTTALGFTPYNSTNPNGYITSSGTAAVSVTQQVTDSRSSVTTPQSINQGVVYDFKANSTEGLSDGGSYFGEMTFRQYGSGTDWSGGISHQLGFTDNGNIWQRSGSSTTWGSWKKIWDSSNLTNLNQLTNGPGYLTGTKVDSITATSPIVASASTGAVTLSHANSGVTAGTYNNVTVNALGHVTSGSNTSYLTSYTETDTLATVTARGATSSTAITLSGLLQLSNQGTINTTTPGTGNYGLHFTGQTTADYATGITWNGGTGTTGAQAGIYVQGSGAYGTKMYIATTDSYATGSKTAISIDHTGLVNFVRQRPQYNGSNLALVSEIPSSVTYATNSSKLYSTDATYAYGASNPYYGYLTYIGGNNRWRFQVSPATPAAVEVSYADSAGSASSASSATSATSAGYLTGGDSAFYGLLYNSNSGDLNTYNSPGLYSSEYTGSTNNPAGAANNGHWIQISDAGGTDVKTQWYFHNAGSDISMRLMWGNANWKSWRKLIHDGNYTNYNSYSTLTASSTMTTYYHDHYAGNGYGVRFWQSDNYKISMGNGSLYVHGAVTDYSIKMQMNDADTARGFTFGRLSYAPVASINSYTGAAAFDGGVMNHTSGSQGVGGQSTNGPLRVVNPGSAAYSTTSSSITGAIKIRMPSSALYMMAHIGIKVYTYDGASFDIKCGGHTSGTSWYNTFAYMDTQARGALNVRFAYDGSGYFCIFIGETTTTWSYPQVFVTDFNTGYYSYSSTRYGSGWDVTFETSSYGTVAATQTVYPQLHSGNYSSYIGSPLTTSNYSSYALPISGGTVSGALSLSAYGSAGSALRLNWPHSGWVDIWGSSGQTLNITSASGLGVNVYVSSTITAGGNVVANSDETLKTNWRSLPDNFVDKLALIKSGIYDRVDMELTQVGVSAQSLQTLLPDAVSKNEEGTLAVAYGNAALTSAVELAKEVVDLRARVASLENLISKLIKE